MQLANSAERYGVIPKAIHWTMVLLVIMAWIMGLFLEDLPRGSTPAAGLFVHTWIGLAILLLLVVRVFWRLANRPPQPENTQFGPWLHRGATLAHCALYTLLAAVPLMGIATLFAQGDALSLFGIYEIASPWISDRSFGRAFMEAHEVLANMLVILAALHALAALIHHWVFRDRTLVRMLPGG
jgi:cytochrome b561